MQGRTMDQASVHRPFLTLHGALSPRHDFRVEFECPKYTKWISLTIQPTNGAANYDGIGGINAI